MYKRKYIRTSKVSSSSIKEISFRLVPMASLMLCWTAVDFRICIHVKNMFLSVLFCLNQLSEYCHAYNTGSFF